MVEIDDKVRNKMFECNINNNNYVILYNLYIFFQIKKLALYSNKSDDSNEKLKKYFLKVAGSDKEVDWMDLKNILDFAMKGIYYFVSYL